MRHVSLAFFLFQSLLFAAGKPNWDPIPPNVWTMKDTAGKGAVVLKQRFHLEDSFIERTYRFRIFTEQGKNVAELPNLSEAAYDLMGRTVYPDGRVVVFDSQKDLQTKTVLATRAGEIGKKVLVPPGLSSDCVVDIQWKENRYIRGGSGFGRMHSWTWPSPFPISKLEIDISKKLAGYWNFRPGSMTKSVASESSDSKILIMEDIAPTESIPFMVGVGSGTPRLEHFLVNPALSRSYDKDDAAFWQDVVTKIYKPFFEDRLISGPNYRSLSEELRKGLKEGPAAEKAREIIFRLNAQILNLSSLSYAEKAAMKGGKVGWEVDSKNLDQSVEQSGTDGWGMLYLAYSLMKDAGIKPRIAFVADRDQRRMAPNVKNPSQHTDIILGVGEPGKGTMWMDPAMRYATPGLLDAHYQGTLAFVMNTSDWTGKFEGIGTQAASFNQTRYTFHLDIGEDQDAVRLEVGFSGYPEYLERSRFKRLEPKEQTKTLKESLELITKSMVITKAEVRNATSSQQELRWEVEGTQEREAGRRIEIQPFPLMGWPVYVPSKWPETRQEFIVLPYQKVHLAISHVKLPKGYDWPGMEALNHSNEFGRVIWTAEKQPEAGGKEIQVVLRVEVNQSLGPATMYPKLKEFVSWVEEACRRQLIVEKVK